MSTRVLITQLSNLAVQQPVTSSRPSSGSDGVDLRAWKVAGAYGPMMVQLYIEASEATTISAPAGATASPELWGFSLDKWWLLDAPFAGAIQLASDALGAARLIEGVGSFDRLFVAGAVAAGAAIAHFVPLEVIR